MMPNLKNGQQKSKTQPFEIVATTFSISYNGVDINDYNKWVLIKQIFFGLFNRSKDKLVISKITRDINGKEKKETVGVLFL